MAARAAAGLAHGPGLRFCQGDNMPRLMDGLFLHKIRLTGDPETPSDPSLVLHLPMDDNARRRLSATPRGGATRRFSIPAARRLDRAGRRETALAFDGLDDRIRIALGTLDFN